MYRTKIKMMKQTITTLFVAIFLAFAGTASAQLEAYDKDVTMSLGSQPAIVLDMNEISSRDAEEYWQDFVKEYVKLKRNRRADEYYAKGISIPLVSDRKLDIYSKIEDLKGSSRLYLWIDNGGAFVSASEDPKTLKAAKNLVNDFAVEAEKLHVEELLKAEDKNLATLEKDLKGLEKDKESYENDIEDAKEKIAKAEKNIEENAVAHEEKAIEIDTQKNLIIRMKERLASVGKKKTKM